MLFHPLRVLGQAWNVLTGKAGTKGEMTARRLLSDLRDRLFRRRAPSRVE